YEALLKKREREIVNQRPVPDGRLALGAGRCLPFELLSLRALTAATDVTPKIVLGHLDSLRRQGWRRFSTAYPCGPPFSGYIAATWYPDAWIRWLRQSFNSRSHPK